MMAQKHYLHELLQEDQEPFQLKKYIADRRFQLKTTQLLQLKKRKPISSNFCLFSFHESPDPRKSPLFEFPSPHKTPCSTPNRFFLHIPAKTAALLLEAALRIQKQSSKHKSKSKIKNKNNGAAGLFGSIRRRLLTQRKREGSGDVGVNNKLSVKDILMRNNNYYHDHEQVKEEEMVHLEEKKSAFEISFSCSYNGNGRPSSAVSVWSESNEDNKSLDLDLETSCSSQSEDFEEHIQFPSCGSPFRFVLQKCPSSGRCTPDFTSPATSPSRRKKEDKENHHQEIEAFKKFQQVVAEEEEEEKEQCSPVSVLDTPFEDDDEGHVEEDEEGFDLECSYAIVQRAKQQLLHKLRRFEKLAELDPIELEKRMLEQDHDDNENDVYDLGEEEECCEDYELASSEKENSFDGCVKEVLSKSRLHHLQRIPQDMKRLVTDLIMEEEREQNWSVDREVIVKRVCGRLDSWKEVESNTIDMMVEQDIRKELDGWKRNQEQVGETALEIELAIFKLLMEELSEELVVSTGN